MMKFNLPLIALAIGAFAIGTTEFSPMGFLPEIVQGLNISIPQAGMLITAYALGVMIGAPIMTLWFGRFSQRKALIILMAIFTIGNLLAAIAPNYLSLMGARVITSLNHGAFFGIGAVVATRLVTQDKQASAVATMFMGLTFSSILGVPLATWYGQYSGWREAFAMIAILGLITMFSLWKALPEVKQNNSPNIRQELRVFTRLSVILALMTTTVAFSAMFTLFTFIAPSLNFFIHATPQFITVMLVFIGIGFSIGNYIGGILANYSIYKTLMALISLQIVMLILFPFLAQSAVTTAICLSIWGAVAFGVTPALQMRVMSVAHDAPGLASSVNIGAFNLGNAIGAAVGAAVLSLGLSYAAVSFAGAVLAAFGLLLVLIQMKLYPESA